MQMSTRNISSRLAGGFVLVLALSLASPPRVNAQTNTPPDQSQRTYPVVSWEVYYAVLDIVFPRNDPDTSSTIYDFVLRFEPSFHATSQIVIRTRGDKTEVIEYTSPDGNIFGRLNEALARGAKQEAATLAKSIRVKRREIAMPEAQIKGWYKDFFDSLTATGKTLQQTGEESLKTRSATVVLDGTTYNVWYQQGLNKTSLSLYDVEVDTPGSDGELKLVQWMNRIRREVAKTK
jgi:hypothetical protein